MGEGLMEGLSRMLAVLNTVPFSAELFLFILLTVPGVLLISKDRRSPETITKVTLRMLSVAILLVGIIKVGLQMSFGDGFPFWLLVSNTVIAAVVFAFSFFQIPFQVFTALCLAFVLHLFAISLFTHVTLTRSYPAIYKLGAAEMGPGSEYSRNYVELNLRESPGYFFYMYSEPLTRHLAHSGKMEVSLEVQLRYHWGLLAGHTLEQVDGHKWKTDDQGGFGVRGTKPTRYPFPKTYYGFGD
jgi:hypothetical protein